MTLPDGLKAYVASGVTADGIELTEIGRTIPAYTPVLLEDTKKGGWFTLAIVNDREAPQAYGGMNLLEGSTARRVGFSEGDYYALVQSRTKVVFAKNGSAVTAVPANKAYLPSEKVAASASAGTLNLYVGGTTTGIDAAIATGAKAETYYDLNGRRVLYPSNGIYVTSKGKKVFIK